MSERQNQKWGNKKEKKKVFKSQVKLYEVNIKYVYNIQNDLKLIC